ncbi:MAG: ABC transporter substrate-binding protein [Candidatus Micrarchaeota archaeon]
MNKQHALQILAIVIIIAVGIWFTNAQLTGHAVAQEEKIKIGVVEHAAGLPYFIAIENKYFEAEGLRPEYIYFSTTKPLADALAAGQIDAGLITYSLLLGAEARAPGEFKTALMVGEDTQHGVLPLLVPVNSSITSISQLKGKKIGLAAAGMTPIAKIIFGKFFNKNEIELIDIDSKIQTEVLAAGRVDALFATEPQATTAVQKGIGRVLERSPRAKYVLDPFPAGAAVVFKAKYTEQHPVETQKIIAALERAVDYLRANETNARAIMAKQLNLPAGVAENVPLYQFYKQSEITPTVKQSVQQLADIMQESKQLDKKVETSALFYNG